MLRKAYGVEITADQLDSPDFIETLPKDLRVIEIVGDITNLESFRNLKRFKNLYWLKLSSGKVKNLSFLSHFKNITHLSFIHIEVETDSDGVTDFSPVTRLENLTYLELLELDYVSDVGFVSYLKNLTTLKILIVPNVEYKYLSGLDKLQTLELIGSEETDLSPLSGLTDLRFLNLGGTSVTDLSPLSGLTHLTRIRLDDTDVTDLRPLFELPNLIHVSLKQDPDCVDVSVSDEQVEAFKKAKPNCKIQLFEKSD